MSFEKAPAEKLALAVRKNVRDNWEAKKPALETELSDLLGAPWTFEVNPNAIFVYADPNSYGSDNLGACIHAYFAGFIWKLKYYLGNSPLLKDEMNTVVSSHIITLTAGTAFSYGGMAVSDGKLQIVFHPEKLGTNIDNCGDNIAAALSEAPQPAGASPLSFAARASIKADYDPKIDAMQEKARKILQNDKFTFVPGFEGLAEAFKGNKEVRDDWETNLGSFVLKYFESFVDKIVYEKFENDDMLREGLEEAAPKNTLEVKVVDKCKGYNDIVKEDDSLVILTTPSNWGTNIHQASDKLVDIL